MPKFLVEEHILLVHKPKGITSFDVVSRVRKRLGIKKVGHAGTLDPMAEGLLIVGVAGGTKKLGSFLKLPKSYEARVLFGKRTDTGDITGKVLEEVSVPEIDPSILGIHLNEMQGKITLPVPAYSAIKVDGKKLYARARKGEVFAPPTREMEILEIKNLGITALSSSVELRLLIHVSSGTYIRSIAEELGRRLRLPATLSGLIRKTIGNYSLDDAVEISELEPSIFLTK